MSTNHPPLTDVDTARVFVDVENMYPCPWSDLDPLWLADWTRRILGALPPVPTRVAGCGPLLAMLLAVVNLPHVAVTAVPSTPDAADLRLIEHLELLPKRIAWVVLVSGDHAFTPVVRRLVSTGVHVTVVAVADSLARSLACVASETITLAPHPTGDDTLSGLAWLDEQADADDDTVHIACAACDRGSGPTIVAMCGEHVDRAARIHAAEAVDVCRACTTAADGHTC